MNNILEKKRENIELHNSWLAINSIVGCTNRCKYCFLGTKKNCCFPHYYAMPNEVIEELLHYRYYDESLPLCLFPNTDIFLNRANQKYLLEVLDLIEEKKIKNDLVMITKCFIPELFLKRFQRMIRDGYTIVIYLSYSGLDTSIEPNVNHDALRQNFARLKQYGIPIVHYFRPLISQNSNPRKIQEILDFVHSYTPVSVVTGLMLDESKTNYLSFFDGIKPLKSSELVGYSSMWTKSAWNYFYQDYRHSQYFYRLNTCAYATILKRPCRIYFQSSECQKCHCSKEQRTRCLIDSQRRKSNIAKLLPYYLKKIGVSSSYLFYLHSNNTLELFGEPLLAEDYIYLSHMLGVLVFMKNHEDNLKYNAFHSKPFLIEEVNV